MRRVAGWILVLILMPVSFEPLVRLIGGMM